MVTMEKSNDVTQPLAIVQASEEIAEMVPNWSAEEISDALTSTNSEYGTLSLASSWQRHLVF